ncbi:MAG: tRNA (N(6)-L-threonylcarbamoyladenosine(37)-C(2))-methylthiotransferase MtaB [Alphaproteobacteria bacterium]|nr:tRNA (N(6)-L-threonylcarbamoyladenosine(37)-C(2))-methylthiotransferase MtaB [Alphaproteobacteria bacterium]
MTIDILTFGCRLNGFESEVLRETAAKAGLDDAVIINTCAVTAEAERQARQAIRKLRRERPGVRIIVTGCAAQVNAKSFADMPEVDRVLGNAAKLDVGSLLSSERLVISDLKELAELAPHLIEGFEGRSRAFVQIQQGCDHGCTFCIVPQARGPSRSIAVERIVAQAEKLVEAGYLEIVLTGVDIASWGRLDQLIISLLKAVPGIERLRLTSMDPAEITPELIALFKAEPRLMGHLHLSMQSGADAVLKRMARRHRRVDLLRLRDSLPDIALGADLIAGFPAESEADHQETLELVERLGMAHLHVFPFSSRPGTPAARLKRLTGDVVKLRAADLRQAGERQSEKLRTSFVGKCVRVLVEETGRGLSEAYLPVVFEGGVPGTIATVQIDGVQKDRLQGHIIS